MVARRDRERRRVRPRTAVVVLGSLFTAAVVAATAQVAWARNQWSCWHWGSPDVAVRSAASSSYWNTILTSELAQWDAGTCVRFGSGSQITADAQFYGGTGWLGLARLTRYDRGTCEILAAEALLNRSYLDAGAYDETDDRHVACQEIGHCLGLDHRRGQTASCMNDGLLGFPDYDAHDASVVDAITTGCGEGGGGCGATGEKGQKRCADGVDNDGDGCVDGADPECA